jgi:hypothetical protein
MWQESYQIKINMAVENLTINFIKMNCCLHLQGKTKYGEQVPPKRWYISSKLHSHIAEVQRVDEHGCEYRKFYTVHLRVKFL